jgi:hypothetical protein
MATAPDILAYDISGAQNLQDLEALIKDNETLSSEFVYMEASTQTPGNNLLYYEIHETDEVHDEIVLKALPPNLTQDQAGEFVDHLCDLGLQPFKSYFNVMVSGNLVSILPCRQGQPPATPNIGDWIFTKATVFGLNMDGTLDTADNGIGAPVLGSIRTTDPDLVGCALPIPVLRKKFGSLVSARGQSIEVARPDGTLSTRVRIVDLGPSNAQIAKGIALDLTLGAQRALHGDGLTPVKYRF